MSLSPRGVQQFPRRFHGGVLEHRFPRMAQVRTTYQVLTMIGDGSNSFPWRALALAKDSTRLNV